MASPAPFPAASVLRHVALQGRGRRPLFPDRLQREAAAGRLAGCCLRHGLDCLAWSLTDNGLQLVLAGPAAVLTQAVHELLGQRLRQGRCLSTPVQRDIYLVEVLRHVLNAPVRARLCRHAADWPFSNARELLGLRPAAPWVACGAVYALLGPPDGRGPARLRRLLEAR